MRSRLSSGYFFNFDKMEYVQGKRADGCPLCLIRDGHPDTVDLTVYRDELVLATVNLYPYNPGHIMLFPSRHIEDMREYTSEEERRIPSIMRHLLNALDRTHRPSGYNIGCNMGTHAGASITHLHVHIIPRYPREIGIADLIAGKRVLVEDPRTTKRRLVEALAREPYAP
jgi:ATP adenylyltransferase